MYTNQILIQEFRQQMLIRNLRRNLLRFSREKDSSDIPLNPTVEKTAAATLKSPTLSTSPQQYLVFPTKFPIFPYYIYMTKINRFLHQYITKNNIKYVAAFSLQPGVAKKPFKPYSLSHLEQQLNLKTGTQKAGVSNTQENQQNFEISNNNIIFDGPIADQEEAPIHYVDRIQQIYPVGSVCKIVTTFVNNVYMAHLRSEIRLQVNPQKYTNIEAPIMYLSGKTLKNQNLLQVGSDHKTLLQLYNKILVISRLNLPEVRHSSIIKSIELLGGYLCTLTYFTPLQLYNVFKIKDIAVRTKLLVQYYQDYIKVLENQWKHFNEQNTFQIDEEQQKQHVRQVYEHVQTILGHKADVEYMKKIKAKIASGRYPEAIIKTVQVQLQNIQDLGEGNPQINRKKHYINLLVDYPFGIVAKEDFDLKKARNILDEDHYGMKKIKQRILQFIAVSKIKGQFKSKCILLHGPPGVGKTSIVKSIAQCLNRPYGRISLGGEYDTSIMKGHRKTYIGAYPGKIFDTILKAKAENPVILLDEVDKIQSRHGGASLQDVIMEVLDPIQNFKYKDDYMDIEIDLSKVLFICTANTLQTIFPPLLDRMERIQVSGYTTDEKKQIFRRYILKQSMINNGIPQQMQQKILFTENGLQALIQGHCKQAGVRNLVRKANTIFQKMALQYVRNSQFQLEITQKSLKKYIGLPKFRQARLFGDIPPPGVMVGLAYNAFGGSIMYIQAACSTYRDQIIESDSGSDKPAKQLPQGSLMVTGNIHEVMKESCQLAYSYAKYILSTFFNNHFLETNDIHLNFPEIEIGKDGPSAGVAITCTLVSLALNKSAAKQIAMTGQITLSGKVSAIGGAKEKTMGAKRQGIKQLIFPYDNKRDIEELEEQIKSGMTFHFADHFFEVMELVFEHKIENIPEIPQLSLQRKI